MIQIINGDEVKMNTQFTISFELSKVYKAIISFVVILFFSNARLCSQTITEVKNIFGSTVAGLLAETQINLANSITVSPVDAEYTVTISTQGAKGNANIINNNIMQYILKSSAEYGLDSLEYTVACGSDQEIRKIYIFIYRTSAGAGEYWACPHETAPVVIDLTPDANTTYSWYDENDVPLTNPANPSNSKNIIKNNSDIQKIFVEATVQDFGTVGNTVTFPRGTIYIHKGIIYDSPPVVTTLPTSPVSGGENAENYTFGCENQDFTLDAEYNDEGKLGGPGKTLKSVWEYSIDTTVSGNWAKIDASEQIFPAGELEIKPTYTIENATVDKSGYYRVVIYSNTVDYGDAGCVALSKNVANVKIEHCVTALNDEFDIKVKEETATFAIMANDEIKWHVPCDDGVVLTITDSTDNGTVTINPDNTITYEITNLLATEDSLSYKICCGDVCEEANVQINIIHPCVIAVDDAHYTFGSWAIEIPVKNNDTVKAACSPCDLANATVNINNVVRDTNGVPIAPNQIEKLEVQANGTILFKLMAGANIEGELSFKYELFCDAENNDSATVKVIVHKFPDNVVDACVVTDETSYEWAIKLDTLLGNDSVTTYHPVMIGDLDGDEKPELVIPGSHRLDEPVSNSEYPVSFFYIFSMGSDGNWTSKKVYLDDSNHDIRLSLQRSKGVMGLAKKSDGEGLIVVCATDGYLYAYDKNGNRKWKSESQYLYGAVSFSANSTPRNTGYQTRIMFADFMGNGKPTVVTYGKVWDLENGKLLLNFCNDLGMTGTGAAATAINTAYFRGESNKSMGTYVATVDIDNDGHPEIVRGGDVYKINIQDYNNPVLNSATKLTNNSVQNPPTANNLKSLNTIPADFDNDGNVEILVYSVSDNWETDNVNTGFASMYIYDPRDGSVKAEFTTAAGDGAGGLPFVGSIDDDNVPEILVGEGNNSGNHIYAYEVDLSSNQITEKWRLETGDDSRNTGLTLFDFNQDGQAEIVYRGETRIRVLDGNLQNGTYTDATIKPYTYFEAPCVSGTGAEYPTVADVDGDGQAEIVVAGRVATSGSGMQGSIHIFKAGTGQDGSPTKWAPARPVWNQYNYNVVNVNNDLTIPTRMFDVATVMPGEDGVFGGGDDVQPFNAFMRQATTINQYGNMTALAADVTFVDPPEDNIQLNYDKINDELEVILTVQNIGELAVSPLYVSFYKDPTVNNFTQRIHTEYFEEIAILKNETVTVTFKIPNISTYMPIDDYAVRLNDDGKRFPVVVECNEENSSDTFDFNVNIPCVVAFDDADYTFGSWAVEIPVRDNDSVRCGNCDIANATVTVIPYFQDRPNLLVDVNGNTAEPNFIQQLAAKPDGSGKIIFQLSAANIEGEFRFKYEIDCNGSKDTATVTVIVHNFPDNVVDACSLPPEEYVWTIRESESLGNDSVSVYQSVMVGDLDNDSIPELVVASSYEWEAESGQDMDYLNDSSLYLSSKVFIFNMNKDGNWESKKIDLPTNVRIDNDGRGVIGLAKPTEKAEGLIVIAANDGYLYAYNKAGDQQWKSDAIYSETPPSSIGRKQYFRRLHQTVMFADFMGNEKPTVVIADKIFDLETGKLLLNIGFAKQEFFTESRAGAMTIPVDINKDGHPELVYGGEIYKIDIQSNSSTTGNTATLLTENSAKNPPINPPGVNNPVGRNTYFARTTTVPADFDKDGNVDILVRIPSWNGTPVMYIYDPRNGEVKASRNILRNEIALGSPFVGCIDGDGIPEILVANGDHTAGDARDSCALYAYNVDLSNQNPNQRITIKWIMITTDISSRETGMTLFDFEQSGKASIIYRDEDVLRVFDGSQDNAQPVVKFSIVNTSGTLAEYPVVADVDNDGQAEIIVTGRQSEKQPSHGYVFVYKSGDGSTWAPARPVWNQYNYNVVNVNKDLTVPTRIFDVATVMPGKDIVFGGEDVQPFNGYLQQATTIDQFGKLIKPAADLTYTPKEDAVLQYSDIDLGYGQRNDNLLVFVPVTNTGEVSIDSFCVAVYKKDGENEILLNAECFKITLRKNDTTTVLVTVPNISPYLTIDSLVIRLNDDGETYPVVSECRTDNNERIIAFDCLIVKNDTVIVRANQSKEIAILDNDVIANYDWDILTPPTKGNATKNGTTISYQNNSGNYGIDSLEYFVKSQTDSASAKVYIFIYKPESQEYYACPAATVNMKVSTVEDVTFQWFNSETDATVLSETNDYLATKTGTVTETFWVEATWNNSENEDPDYNIVFPRFPIELKAGEGCGDSVLTGCFVDGTELFKEDFDGNDVNDSAIGNAVAQRLINEGRITYPYGTTPAQGTFSIAKSVGTYNNGSLLNYWHNFADHTFIGDSTKGYFLMFDPDADLEKVMYQHQIDNLCPNVPLSFSVALANLNHEHPVATIDPTITIELYDGNTNELLATFAVGEIPQRTKPGATLVGGVNNAATVQESKSFWGMYGFTFTPQTSSIKMVLQNAEVRTTGNDLAMDDITINICYPAIEAESEVTVCENTPMELSVTFNNNGSGTSFGNSMLEANWQKGTKDLEENFTWTDIPNSTTYINNGSSVTVTYSVTNSAQIIDEGYYRVRIAGQGTDFENSLCVVISDPILVDVQKCGYAISKRNGRWADPETWYDGVLPTAKDTVYIRHFVYTGSTSRSFNGRAYGVGANVISNDTTVAKEGPNESGLATDDGFDVADRKRKLAANVVIQNGNYEGTNYNGTLLIGENPGNSGANISEVDTLIFGKITNFGVRSGNYNTQPIQSTNVFNPGAAFNEYFGLYVLMNSGPVVKIEDSLANQGYTCIDGGTVNIGEDLINQDLDLLGTVSGLTMRYSQYSGTVNVAHDVISAKNKETAGFTINSGGIMNVGNDFHNGIQNPNGTITAILARSNISGQLTVANNYYNGNGAIADIQLTAGANVTIHNDFYNGLGMNGKITGTDYLWARLRIMNAANLTVEKSFINGAENSRGSVSQSDALSKADATFTVGEWFRNGSAEGSDGSFTVSIGTVNIAGGGDENAKFLNGSTGDQADIGYAATAGKAEFRTSIGGNKNSIPTVNIYRSLYNGVDNGNSPATATINLEGGKVTVNESVKSYNNAAKNNVFNISNGTSGTSGLNTNGRLIMSGSPAEGKDSLITMKAITVVNSGQFIIDKNRNVEMRGATAAQNGGLILDANTREVVNYNTLEGSDNGAGITVDNVKGSLAMLRGSVLNMRSPNPNMAGLINNNINRNNVYFHRGKYQVDTNKPSLVSYRNTINIMPTLPTHPYGMLRLVLTSENQPDLLDYLGDNEICIGGQSDSALWFARNGYEVDDPSKNKIVLVDKYSNVKYNKSDGEDESIQVGWNGVIKGTVERRTSIFGNAIESNRDYYFTNRFTKIRFDNAGNALERFALTTVWKTSPTNVIDAADGDKRAQRHYSVDFAFANNATNVPKITAISLTYLGITEASAKLFDMREKLLFGAGFDVTKQPAKLARVNAAFYQSSMSGDPNTQNQNYGYAAGYDQANSYEFNDAFQTDISLKTSGNQDGATLISGNELIMYFGGRFVSQRHGRWSDPETWAYGIVPSKDDTVEIRHIVYTGLWINNSTNLFGARPYGAAEDKLYSLIDGEALLSRKVNIVDPAEVEDDNGKTQQNQPSALIIGADVNQLDLWNDNPTVACQPMDFGTTLVFSDYVTLAGAPDETDDANGINISTPLGLHSITVGEIMEKAKSDNSADWADFYGLYLLHSLNDSGVVPTIRAINIKNSGFILNNAIIEVGK